MIPLRLQIKNFVSYGPKVQIIDFEPYNLICLSGKNGHGKSALLDSITWAIWGQARKVSGTSRADEALLHLGQTNMMVILDFMSSNICYRIRREFSLSIGKKSYSNLEFGIIDEKTKSFRALTDKTIKDTQDKIEKTIGLDYNSFINSVFLRQGQSNEFSKKTPRDRKEVLANILGISHFEDLRKVSLEKMKYFVSQKEYSLQIHGQLKKELESKDYLNIKINQIYNNLDNLNKEELLYKNKLDEIKKEYEFINETKLNLQKILFENEQLNIIIKSQSNEILQEFQNWRDINKQSKNFKNIEKIEKDYEICLKKLTDLRNIKKIKLEIKEQIISKKDELNNYLIQLSADINKTLEIKKLKLHENLLNISNLKNNQEELNKLKENYINNIQNFKESLVNLNAIIKNKEFVEKKLNRYTSFYSKFNNKIEFLSSEIYNLSNKINLIREKCPFCEQNLNLDYKNNLKNNLEKQKNIYINQKSRLDNIIQTLNSSINKQEMEFKIIIENEQKIQIVHLNIDRLNEDLKKLLNDLENNNKLLKKEEENNKHIELDIEILNKKLEDILANDSRYNDLKNFIENLENNLLDIEREIEFFDSEENLILKIEELGLLKANYNNFLKDLSLQAKRMQKISDLCKNTKELKVLKLKKEQIIKDNNFILEKELILKSKEKLLTEKLNNILSQKENLILEKGSIEQQIKVIKTKEKEFINFSNSIAYLDAEIDDYKLIASALSKDGIQALLIEDAIPEIESEANLLLANMTENQSHIVIDSLKDLKSGCTKETLDIKISDNYGLRPYELYSGGEAFRIDFALRIAISKLLARRAGATLQTLIIDEGFGSQDEEGLNNIMNVIYKIQDSFSKIIVVSHLTSMKEQFPVNFFVHKSPQGSQVKVIEQA